MTARLHMAEVVRLACNACNATEKANVTPEAAQTLAATPVTPVTPENTNAEAEKDNLPECTAEWLQAQGVAPLREDVRHIARFLPCEPAQDEMLLRQYVEVWLTTADAESLPHQRDNAGRRAANIFIRHALS